MWREHPNVLTMEQVDELIKGGTQRARETLRLRTRQGQLFCLLSRVEQTLLAAGFIRGRYVTRSRPLTRTKTNV